MVNQINDCLTFEDKNCGELIVKLKQYVKEHPENEQALEIYQNTLWKLKAAKAAWWIDVRDIVGGVRDG